MGGILDSGVLYSAYHKIERKNKETSDQIEGVGEDFISNILDFSVIDDVIEVSDDESKEASYLLAREGLFFGGSTGMIYAAVRKESIQGKKIIIAGDTGLKYASTLYQGVKYNRKNEKIINDILREEFNHPKNLPAYL